MLIYEYKLDGSKKQYTSIEEAIRVCQFIRNKCLRLWMDEQSVSRKGLQVYCAILAKSIHDASWGRFLGWVKSYAVMHGIEVIGVSPQYTSQDCSDCGERIRKTLSTRTHICPTCGLILDRDQNAAINILARALGGTVGHTGTHERVS